MLSHTTLELVKKSLREGDGAFTGMVPNSASSIPARTVLAAARSRSDLSRGPFADCRNAGHTKASALLLVIVSILCVLPDKHSANPIRPESSESSLRVSDMSFSEKLENPCALTDTNSAVVRRVSEGSGDRESLKIEILTELRAKTNLLKDSAQTILNNNVFEDCTSLELPSVATIPTIDGVTERTPEEFFLLFYTSLLNHTAHVYFISHQLTKHTSDTSCNDNSLDSSARSLASHMRELMCILRLCIRTFREGGSGDNDDSDIGDQTSQILNEELVDQPLCSRRSVRDCQTIASTVDLLRTLSTYLQRTLPQESS